MAPTRMDLEMVSGSNQTFEFQLYDISGTPQPIPNDTVEMLVSKGLGKTWHRRKVSNPGSHQDSDNGIVRMELTPDDAPPSRMIQTWWYEVWRLPITGAKKVHVVGELKLLPTNRI